MNNIINLTHGNSSGNGPSAARVSYTINNAQPVISTIIGSTPVFYQDITDEGLLDDEFNFTDEELALMEHEIATLSAEINKLDGLSSQFTQTSDVSVQEFIDTKAAITGENTHTLPTTSFTSSQDLRNVLSQSRLADYFLAELDQYNVSLQLTNTVQTSLYDRESGIVAINASLGRSDQILLALKELRRHAQHRQGALLNPLNFTPESAVLINRAQEADLASVMVRMAWELQLAGEKDAWERIENSSFADLGRAFVREAYTDFRTINNGLATTSVFEAWFLSERCRHVDRTLIRQMLADHQDQVFDVENIQHSITPNLLAALGEMPFGKNYLSKHADTILTDPIFTEVRDRANANFLWFIKFERTFRETEHDLQSEFSSAVDSSAGSQGKGNVDHVAKIITLYSEESRDISQPDSDEAEGKILRNKNHSSCHDSTSDNIVYLRRAPQEL